MIKRVLCLVEETEWDDWLLKQERTLNNFCLAVIIIAILYFLPALIKIFLR